MVQKSKWESMVKDLGVLFSEKEVGNTYTYIYIYVFTHIYIIYYNYIVIIDVYFRSIHLHITKLKLSQYSLELIPKPLRSKGLEEIVKTIDFLFPIRLTYASLCCLGG